MNKTFWLVSILISILIFSCTKEEIPTPNNLDNLEFSTSPIQLNGIIAKFASNIPYGDNDRNLFDIFLPESTSPTSLVIYIHGGGFTGGDKSFVYETQKGGLWDFPEHIRALLNNNIAFATINYRLLETTDKDGVLKPMTDSQRCLQFIRSNADKFNIEKDNIVLAGNSAGAGTSLWIGLNDDLADPDNSDPVLRESTRVKGIAVLETQASYNLQRWETDVFIDYGFTVEDVINSSSSMEQRFNSFYGLVSFDEFDAPQTLDYRDKVDMLELISADDPGLWINNTIREVVAPSSLDIINHHPYHARELKEKADQIGIENITSYGDVLDPTQETWSEFLMRKLSE